MLEQYTKSSLLEILKQQNKRSYIKNMHGSVVIEAFMATMALIKDTEGLFVQRAEMVYKVLDGGSFKPVYILSIHEGTIDIKGYVEFFGLSSNSEIPEVDEE
jgi:hypothetical protein